MKIKNYFNDHSNQFMSVFYFEEHEEQAWVQNALVDVLEKEFKGEISHDNSALGFDEYKICYRIESNDVLVNSDYHFPVALSCREKKLLDDILEALLRKYRRNVGRFPTENLINH